VSEAASSDPLIGRTLGDFILREKIGEGGFGAVYRAEQPLLQREAVVKVLHRQLANEVGTRRFLLEARLASRLDHPYAAHIYAFGAEPDGLLWIAMELVRGTPLDRMLQVRGPLSIERFVPLLERICEVVHSAHEHGIVHRDLKPANVLVLARAGRLLPKLLDFGIAKVLVQAAGDDAAPDPQRWLDPAAAGADAAVPDQRVATAATLQSEVDLERTRASESASAATPAPLTQRGTVVGSPFYMAPEQWANAASLDARTDIYSLGVLAYEAITGRRPFTARTHHELARHHGRTPVPPLGGELPRALDKVIARAMAKDPADRYPGAIEFATDFRAASGLAGDGRDVVPSLDEAVRKAVLADAPQPIAEAVAALAAARNAHQARDAVRDCVQLILRYLGLVALACRSRGGPGAARDAPEVIEGLRAMRRRTLSDEEWLDLSRELCRPFAGSPDAHPIPELVDLFYDSDGTDLGRSNPARTRETEADGFLDLPVGLHRGVSAEQARAELAGAMPKLARLLRSVAFLADYRLVVWRGDRAESWMGIRRTKRAAIEVRGAELPVDRPALVDREGRPLVILWPLVQTARPAPGAPDELFLFDGHDRRGARLVALPQQFERHDDQVWEWFGGHLIDTLEQAVGDSPEERAPYRGLFAFTAADVGDYFGREREVDAFVNRMRTVPLLAVVAPSGAGKSSFVHAGVVPVLPAGWTAIALRPGPSPMASLAARLAQAGVVVAGSGPEAIGEAIRRHAVATGATLVLVVDQFEEVFTLCLDQVERHELAAALAAAARIVDDPVRVVLTLRDDFLLRAEELPSLRERLALGLQLLPSPARPDMMRIVTEPARRAGYEFEDAELPAHMVDAVEGRPGALALLSFTAARLWEARDRHFKQLGRRAYDALGGVAGALAQHAEETLSAMLADEQRLVREALRHLVTAEGTRSVLSRAELDQLLGGDPRADRVVERLVTARLLVASEGDAGGERIEVVHEALLAAWPRLVEWRREDAEGARMRDQLRAAARLWDARGRPRGLLWRDDAWTEYQLWRARYPAARTAVEEAFAAASAAEAARGRWLRRGLLLAAFTVLAVFIGFQARANRETRRARSLAEDKAEEAHALLIGSYVDQGRQSLLAGHHAESLAYLTEARRIGANSSAVDFLIERAAAPLEPLLLRLDRHVGKVWAASFSADGRRMLTADDRDAYIWDAASGALLHTLTGHRNSVIGAAFSPDGARVVTASLDDTATLWDAATGRIIADLPGHAAMVMSPRWSGDGRRIATVSDDGFMRVFDGTSGAPLRQLRVDPAGAEVCALDAKGNLAISGGRSGLIDVFDVASGHRVAEMNAHGTIGWLEIGPTGTLLSASASGLAQVWQLPTGREVLSLVGHGDRVDHASFSPDGKWIATAGRDGTARVWDAASAELVTVLRGHKGLVYQAVFDPTSTLVATSSDDLSAAIWDRATGRRVATFEGHGNGPHHIEFSPDGQRLLTASYDGAASVWRVGDFYAVATFPPAAAPCNNSRSSNTDSRYATLACEDGVRVWDLQQGALVATLPPADLALASRDGTRALVVRGSVVVVQELPSGRPLRQLDRGATVDAIDWAPDGASFLTATSAGAVHLTAVDGDELRRLQHGDPVIGAAFDPTGTTVVTADALGTIRRFDVNSGALLNELVEGRKLDWFRLSPRGDQLLAVPSLPATDPTLWDVERGARIAVLSGHVSPVFGADFDSEHGRLVTASGDGVARIWDTRSGQLLGALRGSTPQFLQSASFDPDGALVAVTGGDGAIRFWDASTLQLLWVLDAHGHAGTDVRFMSPTRLVSRGFDGEVLVWQIDRRRRQVAELDGLLRCRSPVVFDRTRGALVPHVPSCP
jgi:WD40 repeat protein/serine/threonine protein kinase